MSAFNLFSLIECILHYPKAPDSATVKCFGRFNAGEVSTLTVPKVMLCDKIHLTTLCLLLLGINNVPLAFSLQHGKGITACVTFLFQKQTNKQIQKLLFQKSEENGTEREGRRHYWQRVLLVHAKHCNIKFRSHKLKGNSESFNFHFFFFFNFLFHISPSVIQKLD